MDRKILREGNGTDIPKVGDNVSVEYTGWLYDTSKANEEFKGKQYVLITSSPVQAMLCPRSLTASGSIHP
jgi:FKBP-type peptidyl-prolyl cis-trans isomerase